MTQKEKLCKHYLTIKNEYYTLIGEKDKIVELNDKYLASQKFKSVAANEKVEDWQRSIYNANISLQSEKRKLRTAEFYNTEKGKKLKSELEQKQKELSTRLRLRTTIAKHTIETAIMNALGENWGITSFGTTQLQIGYIKEVHEKYKEPYFGHTFTLYYDGLGTDTEVFQISYGSLGPMDFLNDKSYRAYLIGLGKFVENDELIDTIKSRLTKYVNEYEKNYDDLYKIEVRLKNPFADETTK